MHKNLDRAMQRFEEVQEQTLTKKSMTSIKPMIMSRIIKTLAGQKFARPTLLLVCSVSQVSSLNCQSQIPCSACVFATQPRAATIVVACVRQRHQQYFKAESVFGEPTWGFCEELVEMSHTETRTLR